MRIAWCLGFTACTLTAGQAFSQIATYTFSSQFDALQFGDDGFPFRPRSYKAALQVPVDQLMNGSSFMGSYGTESFSDYPIHSFFMRTSSDAALDGYTYDYFDRLHRPGTSFQAGFDLYDKPGTRNVDVQEGGGFEVTGSVTRGAYVTYTIDGSGNVPFSEIAGEYGTQVLPNGSSVEFARIDEFERDVNGLNLPESARVEWTHTLPQHIIVLNHGWQPNANYVDMVRMPEVHLAIRDRLGEEMSRGEVLLLSPTWEEAFVDIGIPELSDAPKYASSYRGAINQGAIVAETIRTQIEYGESIDSDYDPTIHLIGHSLGTVVNAYAVNALSKTGQTVDVVTLLDTPLLASAAERGGFPDDVSTIKRRLAAYDDALLFWRLMPEGSVDYVENFYATDPSAADFFTAFGQPIAGTGPGTVGQEVPTGHLRIHEEFYSERAQESNDWVTPILSQKDAQGEYIYPGRWNPTGLEDRFFNVIDVLSDEQARVLLKPSKYEERGEFIFGWQLILGQSQSAGDNLRLIANSPAAISASVDFESLLFVEFTYESNDPNAKLSLWVDDVLLWEDDDLSTGLDDAFVLLTDVYGVGDLQWRYDSDQTGSYVELGGLNFGQVVAVPEPTSGLLLAVSLLGLTRRCRRRVALPKTV